MIREPTQSPELRKRGDVRTKKRKEMTVTYMQHVHTANFGSFIRLLALWRGSIFKGIGRNILVGN